MDFWNKQWREQHLEHKIRKNTSRFITEERTSRREEIVLCRLRTKTTVLTHVLPFINGEPSLCEHCDEPLNIQHILLDCLLYYRHRANILTYMHNKGKRINLYHLLEDDTEQIDLLIKYLKNTKLFNQI